MKPFSVLCPPDELKKSNFLSNFLNYWYVINRYDTGQVYSVNNSKVIPLQFSIFSTCLDLHFELLYVSVGRYPEKGGKSECWWNYMGGYMLQVTINESKCMHELWQDILRGNARYLYVK
jgi:hypothetical protein